MSNIRDAFGALLADTAAISAIVGNRVWYKILPQPPEYPAISYFAVVGMGNQTHDDKFGARRARFQINCWAPSDDQANQLAEAVLSLVGFRGPIGVSSPPELHCDGVLYEGEPEMPADFIADSHLREVRVRIVEVTVWYR